jgi:UDP-GlcNAc:undecaprenyl-phosphate GlcNAc-1-phosphate transferase
VLIIYGIAAFFGTCAVIQSSISNTGLGNWITFIVICALVFLLQIGAELIGIVDQTRRPLLNFLARLRMKPQTDTHSK